MARRLYKKKQEIVVNRGPFTHYCKHCGQWASYGMGDAAKVYNMTWVCKYLWQRKGAGIDLMFDARNADAETDDVRAQESV